MCKEQITAVLNIVMLEMYATLILLILYFKAVPTPGDYQKTVMPLTFTPTVRSFIVSVLISDDNLLEVDEDFFGNLRVLDDPSGLVVLDPAVATATIIDNDSKIFNYEV